MKRLRDLKLSDLNRVFERATRAAKQEAAGRGLPAYGLDEHGQLQEPKLPDPALRVGDKVA